MITMRQLRGNYVITKRQLKCGQGERVAAAKLQVEGTVPKQRTKRVGQSVILGQLNARDADTTAVFSEALKARLPKVQ